MAEACTESTSTYSDLQTQIEQLKQLSSKCTVIENVGDLACLINTAIPKTKVIVKFQLTDGYPSNPATVLVRGLQDKDIEDIEGSLQQMSASGSSLVNMFETAVAIIESLGIEMISNGSDNSVKKKSINKKSKKKKCGSSTSDMPSKKPSMRTAADVVKRIQWDSKLDKEKFIVGYLDRFTGVIERSFTEFNWVNPAAADWMDLNIPEHRIEYFKYQDKLVWDKKSRLDNIFGSTGGSSILEFEPVSVETRQLANTGDQDENSDSEDELNIVISANTTNPCSSETIKQMAETAQIQQKSEPKRSPPEVTVRESRDKPNHFIAIPITDPDTLDMAKSVQLFAGEKVDVILDHTVLSSNLHVTICALRINTDEEFEVVEQCLKSEINKRRSQLIDDSSMSIEGLAEFNQRVLYAPVQLGSTYHDFVNHLCFWLKHAGIKVFIDEPFVPHLTLAKFPAVLARERRIKLPISECLARHNGELKFGIQTIEHMCLYSMERNIYNGTYIEVQKIPIPC